MVAALTILLVLTLSVLVIRIAGVALRITGLPPDVARFQARSAFTGAGFTTQESEAIVNDPLRRRIIGNLMVAGNLGIVTVSAALIVSLVNMGNTPEAVTTQFLWFVGVLALFWLIALNPLADRLMCAVIGWILHRVTSFGHGTSATLLQLDKDHSIREIRLARTEKEDPRPLIDIAKHYEDSVVLGLRRSDGSFVSTPAEKTPVAGGDVLIVYGPADRPL